MSEMRILIRSGDPARVASEVELAESLGARIVRDGVRTMAVSDDLLVQARLREVLALSAQVLYV